MGFRSFAPPSLPSAPLSHCGNTSSRTWKNPLRFPAKDLKFWAPSKRGCPYKQNEAFCMWHNSDLKWGAIIPSSYNIIIPCLSVIGFEHHLWHCSSSYVFLPTDKLPLVPFTWDPTLCRAHGLKTRNVRFALKYQLPVNRVTCFMPFLEGET